MREEDLKDRTFCVRESAIVHIVGSLDTGKPDRRLVPSGGFPMRTLEIHMMNDQSVVASVFSCKTGGRYVIVFNVADVELM